MEINTFATSKSFTVNTEKLQKLIVLSYIHT